MKFYPQTGRRKLHLVERISFLFSLSSLNGEKNRKERERETSENDITYLT